MTSTTPALLRRAAAADYLETKWGIPCSKKTLAKLASIGGGPSYRLYNRTPLYSPEDLDAFAERKLSKSVRSTSEYGAHK
jgi:hypothetical protein